MSHLFLGSVHGCLLLSFYWQVHHLLKSNRNHTSSMAQVAGVWRAKWQAFNIPWRGISWMATSVSFFLFHNISFTNTSLHKHPWFFKCVISIFSQILPPHVLCIHKEPSLEEVWGRILISNFHFIFIQFYQSYNFKIKQYTYF